MGQYNICKSLIGGLFLLPLLLIGEESDSCPCEEPAPKPCCITTDQGESCCFTNDTLLKSSLALDDCCNFSLSGSLLVWSAHEEGLDYVIKNSNGTAFVTNGAIKRIDPSWDVGFRLDLGYQIPDCRMDLDLIWTRFHTKESDSATASPFGGLYSVWSVPGAGLSAEQEAKANWTMHYDQLDLQMSGTFAPRSFLELSPLLSLTNIWVRQKFDINLNGGASTLNANALVLDDDIDMKNNFWGIGPKLGLDTLWILGCGFSIYGNFDTALLFGYFKLDQSENVELLGLNPEITYLTINGDKFWISRALLHLDFGLRWDKFICNRSYRLTLQAGWEELFLFGQNQLMRFQTITAPGINLPVCGDLTLQGFTLKALFAF